MTSPAWTGGERGTGSSGSSASARPIRLPGVRPTSPGPLRKSSSDTARADSVASAKRPRSMALQVTSGHSRAAVLSSPASPPESGSPSAVPSAQPKNPSRREMVVKSAPPVPPARRRAGAALFSSRKAFSRKRSSVPAAGATITSAAISTLAAIRSASSTETSLTVRPFARSSEQSSSEKAEPSSVTHSSPSLATAMLSAVFSSVQGMIVLRLTSALLSTGRLTGCAVFATGAGFKAAPESRWRAISPSVRNVPRCSGPITGEPGMRSCSAERISTRLIESMPRSESMPMSSSSISTG